MEIINTILSLIAIGLGFYIIAGIIGFLVCMFLIYRFLKMHNKVRSEFQKRGRFQ